MKALLCLFPGTRSEILRILFTDPSHEIHLRALARACGVAVGNVQPEVAQMSQAGFLLKRRDGNRLYYRANAQHPLFPELQGIVRKTSGHTPPPVDDFSPTSGSLPTHLL